MQGIVPFARTLAKVKTIILVRNCRQNVSLNPKPNMESINEILYWTSPDDISSRQMYRNCKQNHHPFTFEPVEKDETKTQNHRCGSIRTNLERSKPWKLQEKIHLSVPGVDVWNLAKYYICNAKWTILSCLCPNRYNVLCGNFCVRWSFEWWKNISKRRWIFFEIMRNCGGRTKLVPGTRNSFLCQYIYIYI